MKIKLPVLLRLLVGLGLIVFSPAIFAQSLPPQAVQPFSKGSYYEPLATISCPSDEGNVGSYYEEEYQEALAGYCDSGPTPAGYWVYRAPNWIIYRQFVPLPGKVRAAIGGKYKNLQGVYSCPAEEASDIASFGEYYDAGWEAASDYCGQAVPEGYWVWVNPHWYLWGKKDLKAIGFNRISDTVALKDEQLKLVFEFRQEHQAWAEETLTRFKQGLVAMEKLTGLPFPGENPYLMEEHPNFSVLGMAGQDKMTLSSPPRGSAWTLLHEMVHIWNVNVTPDWVNEGHANFLSYLMVKELGFPFIGEETLPIYLADWRKAQASGEDLPLHGNYNDLPAGKAMDFWKLVYELGGPEVMVDIFRKSLKQEEVNPEDIESWLTEHLGPRTPQLFPGWIKPGKYRVNQAKDWGRVVYPLP